MRLPRFRFVSLSGILAAGGIALSAVIAPAVVPAPVGGRVAQAQVDADIIDLFREALSPYGRWFGHDRYGEVWQPVGVHRGWRPYYDDGRWAYSDEHGWMWVSEQPWGWAPFHYGRWAYTRDYGWIWVPGRQWGPAWVTFRSGPDSIGWAPLPPEVDWDPDYGFRNDDYDDDHDDYDEDGYYGRGGNYGLGDFGLMDVIWSFVRPEGFLEPRFRGYAYDRRDYPRIIHRTRNVTNITVIDDRVVNRSIEVKNIERATRKRVERVRVIETDRRDRLRKKGRDVVVYRPIFLERDDGRARARGDMVTNDEPRRKRKRRSDGIDSAHETQRLAPDEIGPSAGVDVGTDQPRKKKKKKRRSVESDETARAKDLSRIEPSAGVASDGEQPVKRTKKKKRNAGSDGSGQQQFAVPNNVESAGDDGAAVRKKKQRDRGQAQFNNLRQQQEEQPRKTRKAKKCKGDGCPQND